MGESPEGSNSSNLLESLGVVAETPESVTDLDQLQDFKMYYQEFSRFREKYPLDARGKLPPDISSRQLLMRFTVTRLHELSTDVYDEVLRRLANDPQFPRLSSNKAFPSKRNRRRKKMANYTAPHVYDICSVIRDELVRRYPDIKEVPSVPSADQRLKFKAHFETLTRFLDGYSLTEAHCLRYTLLQALSRLTLSQALEISTDICEEILRRMDEPHLPCLRLKLDLTPRRNQARQSLASIPSARMQVICGDLQVDIFRRFPDFILA